MISVGPLRISRDGLTLASRGPSPLARWIATHEAQAILARRLALLWIGAAAFFGAIRMLVAPSDKDLQLAPYVLVAVLPAFALYVGFAVFRRDPGYRFAGISITGRWVPVSDSVAKTHPLYGNDGLLLMLSGGLLFSILVRAFDFYVAMPPMFAGAPSWFPPIYAMMLGDMLLMSAMYALCFAAMLKHSPLFPQLLAMTWMFDIGVLYAGYLVFDGWAPAPDGVEAMLTTLLLANVKKAMISIALWAPYLLLSRRANVTFLRRVRPNDMVLVS